jgi:hypothetical protein
MFDSWLTLSGSSMDLRSVDRAMTPDLPLAPGGAWGRPLKFATFRDPRGRFEVGYPLGWTLETGPSVLVRSTRLPLFARVDVLPRADSSWIGFREALETTGATLTPQKEMPSPTPRLRGLLDWNGTRFDVRARAYSVGTETVIFSVGCGVRPELPFRAYEAQVLAALHREFRVPAKS